MRAVVASVLRWLGVVQYDLLARRVSAYPEDRSVSEGELVFVVDAGIEKWACLRCPGGCGALIPLSLNPKRRPRWSLVLDWLRRPTVRPSVHQTNACGCHFHVTAGKVDWCDGGRPTVHRGDPAQKRTLECQLWVNDAG